MEQPSEGSNDYSAWKNKEEHFHASQIQERAIKRIREGRASSFDIHFINTRKCGVVNLQNPIDVPVDDELSDSIKDALEWETDSVVKDYWKSLQGWCKWKKLKINNAIEHVLDDVMKTVEAVDTIKDLSILSSEVEKKGKIFKESSAYWNGVFMIVRKRFFALELKEIHSEMLLKRRAEGGELIDYHTILPESAMDPSERKEEKLDTVQADGSPRALQLYTKYTEMLMSAKSERFYDEAKDLYAISRQKNTKKPLFVAFIFRQIVWTRYNQAHYNSNNPPPLTPQGFRFYLFYPEAFETPTYQTEPDPRGTDDTQILRFTAKPYHDLLFRIPAQKWELGHKHGFVCTFENDVLTLSFRFVRLSYRR